MPPKSYSFWDWTNSQGQSKSFSKEDSQLLEKAYKEYRRAYFSVMPPAEAAATPEGGEEAAPAPELSAEAAAKLAATQSVQITVNGQTYTCDFKTMTQKNDKTGKSSPISRVTGVGNNVKKDDTPKIDKRPSAWKKNNADKKDGNNGKKEQTFNHKFAPKNPISKQTFDDSDDEKGGKKQEAVIGQKRARSSSNAPAADTE